MAEERVDFRELGRRLAAEFRTRIEMWQVGARDEARLTADYERCGQYCCCKGFLKVLRPVSMKSAKVQKATLDPLKISGRCGRLMCCLRYEDQTYKELKANLPHRKSRVGTTEGPGLVVETKTLVQLVLVRLEETGREIAVPVEELMDPSECPTLEDREKLEREAALLRDKTEREVAAKAAPGAADDERPRKRRRRRGRRQRGETGDAAPSRAPAAGDRVEPAAQKPGRAPASPQSDAGGDEKPRRKRRRRRGGRRRGGGGGDGGGGGGGGE